MLAENSGLQREMVSQNASRERPEPAMAGSHARETLARRGLIGARVGPAWGPRSRRGTANYYLIARITEYNGLRPLKAAATTPGINELWRDINSGLNTTYKT